MKYAPQSSHDLIGNKASYSKLILWLKSYYRMDKKSKDFKPLTLLIGSPGIGKTSGIIAIANELEYEIIEFNASDQRNAKVIASLVGRASRTKHNPGFKGRIVLLDEVDGIHGNEDRGGLSSLLKVAKESRHPIICTANDPNSSKMRSFKRSVVVTTLTFKKPSTTEVITLLEKIVQNEKLLVSSKVLKVVANNSKGDIRGSINDLENLAQDRKEIPIKAIQALSIRDTDTSIDLALSQIFGEAKTLRQAHEVTSDLDVDYSMFMNYVVENIFTHASNSTELMNMYSYCTLSDLFYARIIFTQYWIFLKYCFYFLSAGIRSSKKSNYVKSYPKFPSLLMDLSRSKKVRGLRDSVTKKLGGITHSSKYKTADDTLPYIRLFFEELFNLYTKKQINTPKGESILLSIAKLHNSAEFSEDEFFYLFNDPLYEKPTKAVEKKQKVVIKLIEEKAFEVRLEHIQKYSNSISQRTPQSFLDHLDQKQSSSPMAKETKNRAVVKTKSNNNQEGKIKKSTQKISTKKASTKKEKKKKSISLLDFTESENGKKKKRKTSKSLSDFV